MCSLWKIKENIFMDIPCSARKIRSHKCLEPLFLFQFHSKQINLRFEKHHFIIHFNGIFSKEIKRVRILRYECLYQPIGIAD